MHLHKLVLLFVVNADDNTARVGGDCDIILHRRDANYVITGASWPRQHTKEGALLFPHRLGAGKPERRNGANASEDLRAAVSR